MTTLAGPTPSTPGSGPKNQLSSPSANATPETVAKAQTQCPPAEGHFKDVAPIVGSTIGGLIAFGIAFWTTTRAEATRKKTEAIEAERDVLSRAAIMTTELVNATIRYCDTAQNETDANIQAAADSARNADRELEFILTFILDGAREEFRSLRKTHRYMMECGANRATLIKHLNSLPKPPLSELHILEQQSIHNSLGETEQLIRRQFSQLKEQEEKLLAWVKQKMRDRNVWPPKATRV